MYNNNRNNGNGNNGNRNRDLTHTNANIAPTAIIYTVSNKDVQNFFEDMYADLDGFQTIRIFGEKGGRAGAKLQAFAFIDANSGLINKGKTQKNNQNISPIIRSKINVPISASSDLYNKFKALAPNGEVRVSSVKGNNKDSRLAMIELDPFALLGLMLGVNPRNETLVVSKVELVDHRAKTLRITACKQYRNIVSDNDINDVYNEIYNKMRH